MTLKILYLSAGGVAGTLCRYFLSAAVAGRFGSAFPWGTFTVNMAGCFLVGFLDTLLIQKLHLSPQARMMVVTGFCAAFTTFSTFIIEATRLAESGHMPQAALYVCASVLTGVLLFRAGLHLAVLLV